MPFSYFPEQILTKATRSRCWGSMFAWILNAKPVKAGSVGSMSRRRVCRGCGGGAYLTKSSSSSATPKLFIAEPK